MTTTQHSTRPTVRLAWMRQIAHSAILAGAIAAGAAAFGHTAIANAEWDIEAYDNCVGTPHKEDPQHTYHAICCVSSGGDWNGSKCTAPANLTIQHIPLGPALSPVPQASAPTSPVTTSVS